MSASRHVTLGRSSSGARRAMPTISLTCSSALSARTVALPTLPVAPMTTTFMCSALPRLGFVLTPSEGVGAMAWDFSTDPEFQEQLDWMREFVREEIWPLEVLNLDYDQMMRAMGPLQEQVKARGLWAAHLDPELGGQGFGQVKLGLMHEVLGTSPYAPFAFGNQAPDSGNSEILALAGTPEQKERWLDPLLAGDLHSAFSMTEPENAGSDPTTLTTRAVRDGDEWVINGHKWFSSNGSIADFLIVMAVTDPDARPHQRASMLIVPADTPGVNVLRDVPTMEHPQEEFGKYGGHAEILYQDGRHPRHPPPRAQGAGVLIAPPPPYPARRHPRLRRP